MEQESTKSRLLQSFVTVYSSFPSLFFCCCCVLNSDLTHFLVLNYSLPSGCLSSSFPLIWITVIPSLWVGEKFLVGLYNFPSWILMLFVFSQYTYVNAICAVDFPESINIVTYRPIARQRLGKHIPTGASALNNRTSVARQEISKQASLTIEAVFSAWSVQSGYKEVFSSIWLWHMENRVSRRQPAGILASGQRNLIEFAAAE
jgi:hypothetical protein